VRQNPRNACAARFFEKLCVAVRSAVSGRNRTVALRDVDESVISLVAYIRFWRRFIELQRTGFHSTPPSLGISEV
jgi:hypothetical protein